MTTIPCSAEPEPIHPSEAAVDGTEAEPSVPERLRNGNTVSVLTLFWAGRLHNLLPAFVILILVVGGLKSHPRKAHKGQTPLTSHSIIQAAAAVRSSPAEWQGIHGGQAVLGQISPGFPQLEYDARDLRNSSVLRLLGNVRTKPFPTRGGPPEFSEVGNGGVNATLQIERRARLMNHMMHRHQKAGNPMLLSSHAYLSLGVCRFPKSSRTGFERSRGQRTSWTTTAICLMQTYSYPGGVSAARLQRTDGEMD